MKSNWVLKVIINSRHLYLYRNSYSHMFVCLNYRSIFILLDITTRLTIPEIINKICHLLLLHILATLHFNVNAFRSQDDVSNILISMCFTFRTQFSVIKWKVYNLRQRFWVEIWKHHELMHYVLFASFIKLKICWISVI